jgi:protein-tyrosine phosphatase
VLSDAFAGAWATEISVCKSYDLQTPARVGRAVKVFFVTKRLAFGSAITTWRHVIQLQDMGITHVINLRRSTNNRKVRQFDWLWLPFKDDKKKRPRSFYHRALKFHKRAARERNSRLLVMCHHGICRSASLVYFLLRARRISASKAELMVRDARRRVEIARAYRDCGEKYLRKIGSCK